MGSFSGPKNKLEKWAAPYAQQGLADIQGTFNANKDNLAEISNIASDAATGAAGNYGRSPFVDNAQGAARTISNGYFLGDNPGQGTYDRLQGGPGVFGGAPMGGGMMAGGDMMGGMAKPMADTPRDPSMNLLNRMATNSAPGAGNATLMRLQGGGQNPGDDFASAVAGGQYLNAQPSAGVYGQMMDQGYSTSNPFLEDIIRQNSENVMTQANRRFAAGGSGLGSAFADTVTRGIADSANQLRYQNYSDAENRRLAAAGQSDAAFSSERGRMMDASGLLSSNYNQGQDRSLAAAQGLNANNQADASRMLSAAQGLGSQFNAGADRSLERYSGDANRFLDRYKTDQSLGLDRYKTDQTIGLGRDNLSLDAAKAADANRSDQVSQMLQALGLTSQLEGAQYAGYGPTTDLLQAAATIPYVGMDAYGSQLANILGQSRKQTGAGIGGKLLSAGAQLGSAAIMASDRRLKKNVAKVGALKDGLGIYEFDYIDGKRFGEGRFKGVMADEVEKLRPWALGSKIDGEYHSVDYSKLEAA